MAAITASHLHETLECLQPVAGTTRTRQECILLIEDSEDAVSLVKHALNEYGHGRYSLAVASNLTEGLMQLSNEAIDVVLLDLGLPESSGPISYAWVRQIAPQLPVVVLTGDASEETESALLASGASGYLEKERVSGPMLIEAIRAALGTNKKPAFQAEAFPHDFVGRFRWRLM